MKTEMYILFSLNLCFLMVSSSTSFKSTQIIMHHSVFIERILHALQKLDEEYKPQERWATQSTHTGKLSCTVEGHVMTSEMTIAIEDGQRTVKVLKMQKVTCQNPYPAIDETESERSEKSTKNPDEDMNETKGKKNKGKLMQNRLLAHDATERKKRFDVSSSTADGIRMKGLSAITLSSRYSNIIYGVGSRLIRFLPILRFDLADDFKVTEHLSRMNYSIADKTSTICGFTSGRCPGENNCLIYCHCRHVYRGGHLCGVFSFREPGSSNMRGLITCQKLGLKTVTRKGYPKTTSMDKTGIVYMTIKGQWENSERLLIMSIIRKEGHHEMELKILKEFKIKPNNFIAMDVNKNGILVFVERKTIIIDETKKDILHSENNSFVINSERKIETDYRSLVCWLYEGNGLVLIHRMKPFKRKILYL